MSMLCLHSLSNGFTALVLRFVYFRPIGYRLNSESTLDFEMRKTKIKQQFNWNKHSAATVSVSCCLYLPLIQLNVHIDLIRYANKYSYFMHKIACLVVFSSKPVALDFSIS